MTPFDVHVGKWFSQSVADADVNYEQLLFSHEPDVAVDFQHYLLAVSFANLHAAYVKFE